jgi:hypothetical protein
VLGFKVGSEEKERRYSRTQGCPASSSRQKRDPPFDHPHPLPPSTGINKINYFLLPQLYKQTRVSPPRNIPHPARSPSLHLYQHLILCLGILGYWITQKTVEKMLKRFKRQESLLLAYGKRGHRSFWSGCHGYLLLTVPFLSSLCHLNTRCHYCRIQSFKRAK